VSGFSRTAGPAVLRNLEGPPPRRDPLRPPELSHPVCCWTQSAMAAGG